MSSIVPPPHARLVSSTKYRSRAGSIHIDVPVNPTWPNADADMRAPHDEAGSMVSHPSARELPPTALFVVARRTRAGESGDGIDASPRAPRSTARAKAPTAAAV